MTKKFTGVITIHVSVDEYDFDKASDAITGALWGVDCVVVSVLEGEFEPFGIPEQLEEEDA
jgi:hypothetical protein